MDLLILKYLLNDLTLKERHVLSKWVEENDVNRQILENLKHYWDSKHPNLDSQREEVLSRIKREIRLESRQKRSVVSHVLFRYVKYAAIFIFAFTVAYLFYENTHDIKPDPKPVTLIEKTALPGQLVSLKLPDGSSVKLNADSKLLVPEKFESDSRTIEMTGEAYFDIKSDPNRPFTIKINGSKVIVKGTSFNVRAYGGEDELVAVKQGVVSVMRDNGEALELVKEEMSVLSKDGKKFEKYAIENNDVVFGWTERKVVFQSRSLEEVLNIIERWYDVEIDTVHTVNTDKLYTATHGSNPSLKEVMESVSYVFDFKYTINGKKIIIK